VRNGTDISKLDSFVFVFCTVETNLQLSSANRCGPPGEIMTSSLSQDFYLSLASGREARFTTKRGFRLQNLKL
jgi:hypothetical protein